VRIATGWWLGVAALLLLLPLVAMQFSDEVAWDASDFVAAGLLLAGAGTIYELGVRITRTPTHRIILAIALVTAVFLIWLEAAVGIF
jgi:hypothetical protein